MKTPTRHYHVPLELQALDIEPDAFDEHYYLQESRWKRKNRIRQLKATIARQKKEYERLWESFSHMSKRCCELLYPTDQP